jgi:hypothetical protein
MAIVVVGVVAAVGSVGRGAGKVNGGTTVPISNSPKADKSRVEYK